MASTSNYYQCTPEYMIKKSNGMKVGYSVDDGLIDGLRSDLDPRLPLLQDAHLRDKVVLIRVDHNVVKQGFNS